MSESEAIPTTMRTPEQLVAEWREQTTYTPGDLYSDGRATAFARCADELELSLTEQAALIGDLQKAAEALRIVDFNEQRQQFFCRACRYRDPLGPDGNKLHDDNCPWVHYVNTFKRLL